MSFIYELFLDFEKCVTKKEVIHIYNVCDFGFRLIVNKELIARILEFGDDVVVVAPLGLREAVVEVLKKSLLGYGFL